MNKKSLFKYINFSMITFFSLIPLNTLLIDKNIKNSNSSSLKYFENQKIKSNTSLDIIKNDVKNLKINENSIEYTFNARWKHGKTSWYVDSSHHATTFLYDLNSKTHKYNVDDLLKYKFDDIKDKTNIEWNKEKKIWIDYRSIHSHDCGGDPAVAAKPNSGNETIKWNESYNLLFSQNSKHFPLFKNFYFSNTTDVSKNKSVSSRFETILSVPFNIYSLNSSGYFDYKIWNQKTHNNLWIDNQNFLESILNIFLKINLPDDVLDSGSTYSYNNSSFDYNNLVNPFFDFSNILESLKLLSIYQKMNKSLDQFKFNKNNYDQNGNWINANISLERFNTYYNNFSNFNFAYFEEINKYVFEKSNISADEYNVFLSDNINSNFQNIFKNLSDALNNDKFFSDNKKNHFNFNDIKNIDFIFLYESILKIFKANKIYANVDIENRYSDNNNSIVSSKIDNQKILIWDGDKFTNNIISLFDKYGGGSLKKISINSLKIESISSFDEVINNDHIFNFGSNNVNNLFDNNDIILGKKINYSNTNKPVFYVAYDRNANNISSVNKTNLLPFENNKDNQDLNQNIAIDIYANVNNKNKKLSNYDLVNEDNSFKSYKNENIYNESGSKFFVAKEISNSLNEIINFKMENPLNPDNVPKSKNTYFDFEVKPINNIIFDEVNNIVNFPRDNDLDDSKNWELNFKNKNGFDVIKNIFLKDQSIKTISKQNNKIMVDFKPTFDFLSNKSNYGGFYVIGRIKNWTQLGIKNGEWLSSGKNDLFKKLNSSGISLNEIELTEEERFNSSRTKYDNHGYFIIKLSASKFNYFSENNQRVWDITKTKPAETENTLFFNKFNTNMNPEFLKKLYGMKSDGTISFESGLIPTIWNNLRILLNNDLNESDPSKKKYINFSKSIDKNEKTFLYDKNWKEFIIDSNINWFKLYSDLFELMKKSNPDEYALFIYQFENGSAFPSKNGSWNFFRYIKPEPREYFNNLVNNGIDNKIALNITNDYYSYNIEGFNKKFDFISYDPNDTNDGSIKYNFNVKYEFSIDSFKISKSLDSVNKSTTNPYWDLLYNDAKYGLLSEYMNQIDKSYSIDKLFNSNKTPTDYFFELFELQQDSMNVSIKPNNKNNFEIVWGFNKLKEFGIVSKTPNSLIQLNKIGDKFNNQSQFLKDKSFKKSIRIGNLLLITLLPLTIIFSIVLFITITRTNKNKRNLLSNKNIKSNNKKENIFD